MAAPLPALFSAALRALRSLLIPGMFRVMALSVALTIVSLIGFVIAATWSFAWIAAHWHAAIAPALPWLGGFGSAFIAWLLFPGVMPVIVNFFDNRMAELIERQDYPGASFQMHQPDFWAELLHDARFSLITIALNLLILPCYFFIPMPLLFYPLNGYLLGREFFVMAARRHMPVEAAEALRKRHSRIITIAGILLMLAATIPIVNLFAPFWGVALMVHLYHRLASLR